MKKISACLLLVALALSAALSDAAVPSLVELQARKFMPDTGTGALDIALQNNAESRHFLVQLGRFVHLRARHQSTELPPLHLVVGVQVPHQDPTAHLLTVQEGVLGRLAPVARRAQQEARNPPEIQASLRILFFP